MSLERHHVTEFERLRPFLLGLAYRMLGEVRDAEDIVQDAYLRFEEALARDTKIESPRAFLAAVVTRLAIDHLRSARVRREEYSGLWLPEPVTTDTGTFAEDEHDESLSMAFLVLLERLNPIERAILLLHDVFEFTHAEIAAIVGKTEQNCRRIASRARSAVAVPRVRFPADREQSPRLAARFFEAVRNGDIDGLIAMLASDATVYGDGGGKVPQWTRPIDGASNVARLLAGVGAKIIELGGTIEVAEINGSPGAIVRDTNAHIVSVFSLEVNHGRVQAVRSVVNPDKLSHLGPLTSYWKETGRL